MSPLRESFERSSAPALQRLAGLPRVVPFLVVLALLLAFDRARNLGSAMTATSFVAQQGSMLRQRDVLELRAVIGWKTHATFFQRRVGVCTLSALTAAGAQHYDALDVTTERAAELIAQANPDWLRGLLIDEGKETGNG